MGMKCWLRIADDCFPASNFASSLNLGSVQGGELANLQIDVGKFLARRPSWSRFVRSYRGDLPSSSTWSGSLI